MPDKIKQWLTEEEWEEYECCLTTGGYSSLVIKDAYESLAATRELSETRRALLKKHEYSASGFMPGEDPYPLCPECRYDEHDGHAPDCAIATALKGVGESEI